eukprot:1911076-Prymnesium_polylepis.2
MVPSDRGEPPKGLCRSHVCTFTMCLRSTISEIHHAEYSSGLAPLLDSLDRLRCTHKTHASQVGGVRND